MPTRLIILALLLGTVPGVLDAQQSASPTLTVTPSLGLAAITRNGSLESGGMSTYLEVDLQRSSLLWSAFAGQRGIGVGCSHGCDFGGQSVGAGVSYLHGPVRVGGGVGLLHRADEWHFQPYGQISAVRGILRAQVRLEVPKGLGDSQDGVHIPVLLGLQFPVH